jgi:hypothetical protein
MVCRIGHDRIIEGCEHGPSLVKTQGNAYWTIVLQLFVTSLPINLDSLYTRMLTYRVNCSYERRA